MLKSLGSHRHLTPSESITEFLKKQPHGTRYRFELRCKEKSKLVPKRLGAAGEKNADIQPQDDEQLMQLKFHVHSLENRNTTLQKQIDSMEVQIIGSRDLKEQLASLQEERSSLSDQYKKEQVSHKKAIQQLQQQLDEASLARRKMEEQLLLTGSPDSSKSLLEEIQSKYGKDISSLTVEIRVKDKSLQEARTRRISLVRQFYTAYPIQLMFSTKFLWVALVQAINFSYWYTSHKVNLSACCSLFYFQVSHTQNM